MVGDTTGEDFRKQGGGPLPLPPGTQPGIHTVAFPSKPCSKPIECVFLSFDHRSPALLLLKLFSLKLFFLSLLPLPLKPHRE